jgi:hypothetical protein
MSTSISGAVAEEVKDRYIRITEGWIEWVLIKFFSKEMEDPTR